MKRIFLAIAIVAMSCMSCKNSSLGIIDWPSFRPGKKIAMVREYWDGWSSETGVTHNHHDFSWIWNGDNLMEINHGTYMYCKFIYDDQNRISGIDIYDGDYYEGRQEFHYDGSKLVKVIDNFEDEFDFSYSGNKIKAITNKEGTVKYSYTWKSGNVTKLEIQGSEDGPIAVYEFKYDSKNNPFYGSFSDWGFSPYNFYKYFSKNNCTEVIIYIISEKGKQKEYNREFSYTYTDDGYPLTIDEKYYDSDGEIDTEASRSMSITYK